MEKHVTNEIPWSGQGTSSKMCFATKKSMSGTEETLYAVSGKTLLFAVLLKLTNLTLNIHANDFWGCCVYLWLFININWKH